MARIVTSVDEHGDLVIEEVYSGVTLKTEEGNELRVCMRDDTFEFLFVPKGEIVGSWHRFNMQTRRIEKL